MYTIYILNDANAHTMSAVFHGGLERQPGNSNERDVLTALKARVPNAEPTLLLAAYLMYRRWTRNNAPEGTTNGGSALRWTGPRKLPQMSADQFMVSALRIVSKYVKGADESVCAADEQVERAGMEVLTATETADKNNSSSDATAMSSSSSAKPPWGQWEKEVLSSIQWRVGHYIHAAQYMLTRKAPIKPARPVSTKKQQPTPTAPRAKAMVGVPNNAATRPPSRHAKVCT